MWPKFQILSEMYIKAIPVSKNLRLLQTVMNTVFILTCVTVNTPKILPLTIWPPFKAC